MVIAAQVVDHIGEAAQLGESPLWRQSDSTLWWTDITGYKLNRCTWSTGQILSYPTSERLCSFGFVDDEENELICAFESGFAYFQPEQGRLDWVCKPKELGLSSRLNDGRVDPAGRFWSGATMEGGTGGEASAHLYRLDEDGVAQSVLEGVAVSNGICWSPQGDLMYFTDTRSKQISVASFDSVSGRPGEWREFVKVKSGHPDGAVTDRLGNLWTAIWGAGTVNCYSRSGELLAEVFIGVQQPTCPAFGGSDYSKLFVSSAAQGLDSQAVREQPAAGKVIVLQTNVMGFEGTRAKKIVPENTDSAAV